MKIAEGFDFSSQLRFVFANINHPLEGMFYLVVLALILRWRWPKFWNNFLLSISARDVDKAIPNSRPKDKKGSSR